MLTSPPLLTEILDRDIIGFLTAVNTSGQPQTAPVWFIRDGEDIVVYNRPRSPRLTSIADNPRVSFNLRGDIKAVGAVILEGMARVESDLPAATDFPGYVEKYAREIEGLGWTPESFASDYSVGLRLTVTRVRSWGLDAL